MACCQTGHRTVTPLLEEGSKTRCSAVSWHARSSLAEGLAQTRANPTMQMLTLMLERFGFFLEFSFMQMPGPALNGSMFGVYFRVTAIPCAAYLLGAKHWKSQDVLSGPLLAAPPQGEKQAFKDVAGRWQH